jgi:cell division protein ZapA
MKATSDGVSVTILGKEFMVSCPERERASLREAAEYLDQKMREIHQSGKVLGSERAAIMAALNITNELLQIRKRGGIPDEMTNKIRSLQQKIDTALRT